MGAPPCARRTPPIRLSGQLLLKWHCRQIRYKSPMSEQVKRLRDLLIGGAVLYVVGLGVMILAWPGTDEGYLGVAESTGSAFWTFVGGLGASAGSAMVMIGLIGFGVKYGREAVRVS